MSFFSEFRAALREETDEVLHLMAIEDSLLGALAREELARRARQPEGAPNA